MPARHFVDSRTATTNTGVHGDPMDDERFGRGISGGLLVYHDCRGRIVINASHGLWSYGRDLFEDRGVVLGIQHARVFGSIVRHVPVAVAGMDVAQLVGTTPRVATGQDALEGLPELGIEYRVDDRVEGRVRVAQPRQDLERLASDAGLAEGGHYVHAEERHPADEEDAHYDTDCDGRLVVGHVVRGGVHLLQLQLGLMGLGSAYAAVVLLLRMQFPCASDGPYGLDVLLCVAVESASKHVHVGV